MNGYGEKIYADGYHYKGNYLNDKRDGLGFMSYTDGSSYEG